MLVGICSSTALLRDQFEGESMSSCEFFESSIADGDILDARNDAMALPVGEPSRRFVSSVVFGQVKRPETMFANVGDNAAQKAPCIGMRRFDKESDLR